MKVGPIIAGSEHEDEICNHHPRLVDSLENVKKMIRVAYATNIPVIDQFRKLGLAGTQEQSNSYDDEKILKQFIQKSLGIKKKNQIFWS